jgi:hypothetical protein
VLFPAPVKPIIKIDSLDFSNYNFKKGLALFKFASISLTSLYSSEILSSTIIFFSSSFS